MRIQFKIKEKLTDIIDEILHSDRWIAEVKEDACGLKRISIKDPFYDSKAVIDIWEQEIHILTAWSGYTYRIYPKDGAIWCEYIGAYRGLLEQKLLPGITPLENILDSEVLDSTLFGYQKGTLRSYSSENVKSKKMREPDDENGDSQTDHPKVVCDRFIKEGISMPSPYNNKEKE